MMMMMASEYSAILKCFWCAVELVAVIYLKIGLKRDLHKVKYAKGINQLYVCYNILS